MQTEQLSIKACRACRSQHKKCDRKLPQCSRCARVSRTCSYDDNCKRGRKTSASYNQPYPELAFRKTVQAPPPSIFSFDFNSIPFKQNDRLFLAMEFVQNELAGQENNYEPCGDDLALVFAIKACMQSQLGLKSSVEEFEKARELVMHKFDQLTSNLALLACSLFLGIYCISANDERGTFFLETVKSYFEKNKITSDPGIDFLRIIFEVTQMAIHGGDLEKQLKRMIAQMNTFHVYRNRSNSHPEYVSFDEMDKLLSDLKNDTDLYALVPQRVNIVSEKIALIHERMSDKLSSQQLAITRFTTAMCIQGAIAQRCFRLQEYSEAVRAADIIARATTSSYFDRAYITLSQVVSLAANVHLFSWCMSTDKQVTSNALDCLQLELNALNMIQSKNKLIGPALDEVVQKISYMLRTAQEHILMNQLTSQINEYQFDFSIEELVSEVENSGLMLENGSSEGVDVIDQFFQDFINES